MHEHVYCIDLRALSEGGTGKYDCIGALSSVSGDGGRTYGRKSTVHLLLRDVIRCLDGAASRATIFASTDARNAVSIDHGCEIARTQYLNVVSRFGQRKGTESFQAACAAIPCRSRAHSPLFGPMQATLDLFPLYLFTSAFQTNVRRIPSGDSDGNGHLHLRPVEGRPKRYGYDFRSLLCIL